ncbi:hypothetical protein REPUB_Repub12eG0037200 [Reevesia pubescens]
MEKLRNCFNFKFSNYVDPIGRAGSLALWWTEDVKNASGFIEVEIASDHSHVFLSLNKHFKRRKRDFKFESKWLLDQECDQAIAEAWNESFQGSRMFKIHKKLLLIAKNLRGWSKTNHANTYSEIEKLSSRLDKIEYAPATQTSHNEEYEIKK